MVGHGDGRAEHLRFAGERRAAAYDWDSLSIAPEAVFAGSAGHAFTTDWSASPHPRLPELHESLAFLDDYQHACQRRFTADEHRLARAAMVAITAYSARCELSDLLTGHGQHPPSPIPKRLPPDGFLQRLAQHGPQPLLSTPLGG